jgi:hypothetical protein
MTIRIGCAYIKVKHEILARPEKASSVVNIKSLQFNVVENGKREASGLILDEYELKRAASVARVECETIDPSDDESVC